MSRLLPALGASLLGVIAALGLAAAPAAAANPEGCSVESRLTTRPVLALQNPTARDAFYLAATYRCARPLDVERVAHEATFVFYDRRGRYLRTAPLGGGRGLVANAPGVLLAAHVACSDARRAQWRRYRASSVSVRVELFRDGGFAPDGGFRGVDPVVRRTSGRVSVSSLCR